MVSIATNWPPLMTHVGLCRLSAAHALTCRVAFTLFGPSLIGLRSFAAVALGLVLVLTGLMARHVGGGRQAQIVAALAAAIGGVAFWGGRLFQYVSFDYLWWVAAAYFMVRLLASDDPRWCLAIGAAIGLRMLMKSEGIAEAISC
jgi:4-amino-4-deoxy-L-arabinose transferase-like glycosyltransferase